MTCHYISRAILWAPVKDMSQEFFSLKLVPPYQNSFYSKEHQGKTVPGPALDVALPRSSKPRHYKYSTYAPEPACRIYPVIAKFPMMASFHLHTPKHPMGSTMTQGQLRSIHPCTLSKPGIPLRIKDLGATYELLETSITSSIEELYFPRSLYPEENE